MFRKFQLGGGLQLGSPHPTWMRFWVTSSVVFPQPLQAIYLTRAIILSQWAMYSVYCVNSAIETAQLSHKSPVVTLCAARYNKESYVHPTQCIHVFCMDLRTNSNCFPIRY
jgi:hypothetical protein